MSQENVEVFKRGVEAWNGDDLDAFIDLVDPEIEWFALMEVYRESVPLGRLATTEEIARVIRFLCSSDASYLTGQNLRVDGGLSAVWPETLARRLKGV